MTTPDPRTHPFRPDLAATHLRGRVDAARYVDGTRRQVARGSVALRRAPRADAPLDTELLHGETVTVYDEEGGWAWLQNDTDGYVGYAEAAALDAAIHAPTHHLAALRSYVFPRPDLKTPPRDLLSMNAAVSVVARDAGFSELADGGWIFSGHLVPRDAFEADPAAVALRFLGAPYLWGGRTSIGLDCSALLQLALARCGHRAPRDSDMQAAEIGVAIADGDAPLRGDLVFWRGHAAIRIDATRIVHANATDMMVSVAPLDDVARRIAADGGGDIVARRRVVPVEPTRQ